MKRFEYYVLGAILVLALLTLSMGSRAVWAQTAPATPSPGGPYSRTITVSGHGQVDAQPDQALVQLGVQNDAATANAALTANSTQMQGLLNAIQQSGVAAADVQTQQVTLSPLYSNPGEGGGTPQLTGYTASNVVQVRVRDLSKLGQMLDSAVRAGGNRVQGIQFVVSNPAPIEAQAREAAWNDAQAKAQQLARLAGAQLGDVLIINESSTTPPRPFVAAAVAGAPAAPVPVQPGTQTVESMLQVTWALGSTTAQGPALLTPGIPGTATAPPTATSPTPGPPGTGGAAFTPAVGPATPTASPSGSLPTLTAGPTGTSTLAPAASGTPVPGITPVAGPSPSNSGTSPSAAAGTTGQQGVSDPFNYCAMVGTIDVPDARYTGPKIPKAISSGLQAALHLPGTPAPPIANNSFWRCMDGKVYACTVGANLPCEDKANTSRQPTTAMQQYCAAQPNSDVIPAVVTGHDTIFAWRCDGSNPQIIRQTAEVDAQGYIAGIWYLISPGYQ